MKRVLLQLFWICFSCTLLPGAEGVGALTNVANVRLLSRLDANGGRPFRLRGMVTLVDAERNLLVVQDSSGALAVHPDSPVSATPGDLVWLEAESGSPYIVSFPAYPYQPSGSEILPNFEAPSDTGDFHLTRVRGFLRPPVSGEYTFWIASDNSSELWLSPDADPAKVRMIGALPSGFWVNPREWTRYQSQQSEPIPLQAGQVYYIEAFAEQLDQAEHLSVAWRGPGLPQALIAGEYLSPWHQGPGTNQSGLFCEFWSNYALGRLTPITGVQRVESAISARAVRLTVLGTNAWPAPRELKLEQPLAPEDNYCWVRAQGVLDFLGIEDGHAQLLLKAGPNRTTVQVRDWQGEPPAAGKSWNVEVTGVCEGAYGASGLTPAGNIWVQSRAALHFQEVPKTEDALGATASPTNATAPLGGFLLARGVVTFNGRARGKDYLVVQDAQAGVFIAPLEQHWPGNDVKIGARVEIGGHLLPSKYALRLRPVLVNVLGSQSFPVPELPDLTPGTYRDGQWTEVEGVVRAVRRDGTLLLRRKGESLAVWVGDTQAPLPALVDATVRLRGVMSLDTEDGRPLLLVPARRFVAVQEAPADPVALQLVSTLEAARDTRPAHRVRIAGIVTYCDETSLFVQDRSGAVQVRPAEKAPRRVGEAVEVLGFPEVFDSMLSLSEALVRRGGQQPEVSPVQVDSAEGLKTVPNQALVRLQARLLSQAKSDQLQTLEVQLGQRVLQAFLPAPPASFPQPAPGSLLRLTGICLKESLLTPAGERRVPWEGSSLGTVRLLLRSPADVVVLRGPPWWSWKKAAVLIAVLSTLLAGAILRAQLMRRRFERQQAARLAFARQLLENQESERRRIAANLHDSLGQNLLAIKNQAHLALQAAGQSAVQTRLQNISESVLQVLEEVRQITHDLRPYQLDRLGLSQTIRALARRVAETSTLELACHVDAIDGLFPGDAAINIFRIVQEGLNNVLKHSQATEAAVVLKIEQGALTISIRDNGRGLRPGQRPGEEGPAGFGLSGIAERARILGGQMELEVPAGGGLNLKVTIPVPAGVAPSKRDETETEVAHSG